MHHIKIINPQAFIKLSKQSQCNGIYLPEISNKDFELPYVEVKPIDGYKPPENFPNCCPFHQRVYHDAVDLLKSFPNCCENHKRLLSAPWFKKKDYEVLPHKLIDTLTYTEFHICNRINGPNWYKDITDYIEYCICSFGQLPAGYGPPVGLKLYIDYLKHYLNVRKEYPEQKRGMLVEFLENYCRPHNIIEGTNINILIGTYNKWLKIFPFEVGYFRDDLKQRFEKQIPILNGQPEHNPYTGLSKAKIKTQVELIELLVNTTKQLLEKVDTVELLSNGLIPDVNKHSLELVNKSHQIKQAGLLNEFSKGEIKYVKVVRKWLLNEKEYFKEITPLMIKEPQKAETINTENSTGKLKSELSRYAFFELQKVKDLSKENKEKIINALVSHDLPYQIAMFDFLGFLNYLIKEHCKTKYILYKKVAEILATTERAIKGNISVLNSYSKEDKKRYTAHLHKEAVQKDYQKLK